MRKSVILGMVFSLVIASTPVEAGFSFNPYKSKTCAAAVAGAVFVGMALAPIYRLSLMAQASGVISRISEDEIRELHWAKPSETLARRDGITYFVREKGLFSLSPGETPQWVTGTVGVETTGVTNGALWVTDADGNLYFQDAKSGKWREADSQ